MRLIVCTACVRIRIYYYEDYTMNTPYITHACNKLEQQISFLIYNKSVPSQLSS